MLTNWIREIFFPQEMDYDDCLIGFDVMLSSEERELLFKQTSKNPEKRLSVHCDIKQPLWMS